MTEGKVFIIGAGPGDYRLLTIKAASCIKTADVVIYDRLVDKQVLGFASANAEMVYVGKQPGFHPVPQEEINALMASHAGKGRIVARVKGGDPFLFGRGGEECEYLEKNGIQFEIVPGITSALAVPAYAGIPVTHRDHASSLHIFTGHELQEGKASEFDFKMAAKLDGTLVFLMGVKNIGRICRGLIDHGKKADTPAAVVENGAGAAQRVIAGTLDDIEEKSREAGVESPAVIVIGSVVKLREKLAWYGKGALSGKRVLVTRPEGQSEALVKKLEEHDALVVEFPVVKIAGIEDCHLLMKALEHIGEYSWLVFTSVNGVHLFFDKMKQLGKDIRLLAGIRLAAVGPATEKALKEKGLHVDYVPEKYTTQDLLEGLVKLAGANDKLLLLRAQHAGAELAEGLKNNAVDFDDIAIYRTEENHVEISEILELLEDNSLDYISFTSPSIVRAFISKIGKDRLKACKAKIVCIGPVTAKAAEEEGLRIAGVADEFCEEGIVKKLIELSEEQDGTD